MVLMMCSMKKNSRKLCPTYISTMDGTYGPKGTVIDSIKENNLTFDHYYACDPRTNVGCISKELPQTMVLFLLKQEWDVALGPAWDVHVN